MEHLISALHSVNGTILHLGAGECRELASYLETAAEQVVLVEPDPELAQALRQRARTEPRVKVIEAAVAVGSQDGEAKLHRYNVTGQATLHPLETLPTQWPGLREIDQLHVKSVDLPQLLKQVVLEKDKQHWLVIQTPGEEQQVLCAIREHEALQRVAYLSLTLGSLTPRIEQTRPELLQALEEAGYCLEHVVTQGGQLVYHAKAGAQWKAYQELKASADQQNKLANELQARNGELRQENRHLKTENEEIQQRQAQLEEELRKAEVQIELIKELFLSKEEEEQLASKEREE